MADLPMSRDEAIAQGAKRYTGRPCRRGHVVRYAAGDDCVECRLKNNQAWADRNPEKKRAALHRWAENNADKKREYQKGYHREWYAKNREVVLAKNAAYQKEHPEVGRRAALKWRNENIEKARGTANQWYKDNPDKRRALAKRKYENNGENIRARNNRWAKDNPEAIAAKTHRRRAAELNAPGTHTAADLADILRMQKHRCAHPGCGADLRKVGKHLDHIMPLALGGSNDRRNLQFLCPTHNLSKGARDPIEFAQLQGRLL